MTDSGESSARPEPPASAADAELADAMDSIEAIGEEWRSSERATETDEPEERNGNG